MVNESVVVPPHSSTWWIGISGALFYTTIIILFTKKIEQIWERRLAVMLGIFILARMVWHDWMFQGLTLVYLRF